MVSKNKIISGLSWEEKVCVFYYHEVVPKKDTKVLLQVENNPLLVVQESSKGKIIVFTGTPLGLPEEGEIPFWEWKDWTTLMKRIIEYLTGGEKK